MINITNDKRFLRKLKEIYILGQKMKILQQKKKDQIWKIYIKRYLKYVY